MQIEYLQSEAGLGRYAAIQITGNSSAIHVPKGTAAITVQVSSITGGELTIQYSLSSQAQVEGNTAIWHNTSDGAISEGKGIGIDTPVAYVRVAAPNAVRYTLEVLA